MKRKILYGIKETTSYPESYDTHKRKHTYHSNTHIYSRLCTHKKYTTGDLNLRKETYVLKEHATIQSETETSVTLKYNNITKKLEIIEFTAFID